MRCEKNAVCVPSSFHGAARDLLVALRRQNSFSHHSFDGYGVLGRCIDTADTLAALSLDSSLEMAGPADQLFSPLSASDVAWWYSFDLTVPNRYQFIFQCKEGVREDVSSSQNAISNAVTCTHPAARPWEAAGGRKRPRAAGGRARPREAARGRARPQIRAGSQVRAGSLSNYQSIFLRIA